MKSSLLIVVIIQCYKFCFPIASARHQLEPAGTAAAAALKQLNSHNIRLILIDFQAPTLYLCTLACFIFCSGQRNLLPLPPPPSLLLLHTLPLAALAAEQVSPPLTLERLQKVILFAWLQTNLNQRDSSAYLEFQSYADSIWTHTCTC